MKRTALVLSVLWVLAGTAPASAAVLGENPRLGESFLNAGIGQAAGDVNRELLPGSCESCLERPAECFVAPATLQGTAERVAELKAAIPAGSQGRITMGAAIVEDANGTRSMLIGTSEPGGYLRPGVTLKPGETMIPGPMHAEQDIINYATANNLKVIEIGATRPVCPNCVNAINPTGATITTPIKKVPGG
jgi:hypothetical protein